jgi:hypothetical protein
LFGTIGTWRKGFSIVERKKHKNKKPAHMSKQKDKSKGKGKPPANIASLIEAVQRVVGDSVSEDLIRKQLGLHHYNVSHTTNAFLDSKDLPAFLIFISSQQCGGFFFFFFFFFFFSFFFPPFQTHSFKFLCALDNIKSAETWEEVKTKKDKKTVPTSQGVGAFFFFFFFFFFSFFF